MCNDLHLQAVCDLNLSILEKRVDFQDILSSCYEKIQNTDSDIRAWKYVTPIEMQYSPYTEGPLVGLCLGVKDIFATIDGPTSMGTDPLTWRGTRGSFDARVISKIRGAGATIIGKNKTSEFAVHEPTDTINPRNHELAPGTSSSGGAAAVAAGHISISISSQTAGSIARPASYCGVIGFKPTFGELPRTGVLKTTESFDTVGIIGNSISNIAAVFDVARVKDLNHPLHLKRASSNLDNVRFLHAIGPIFDRASEETRIAAKSFASNLIGGDKLMDLSELTQLDFERLRSCHHDVYAKELSYFLADELNSESVSPRLRAFGNYGKKISIHAYRDWLGFLYAQRKLASSELDNSIIFALSAADEAPKIGGPDLIDANLLWTSLGLPQISLPLFTSKSGNPIGLSVIGFKGSDSQILSLAEKFFPGFV